MFTSSEALGATLAALAAAAAVGAVVWVRAKLRVRKIAAADAPVKGNPEEGIVLYGFPRTPTCASSLSPYVTKVEAWLRFAKLAYRKENSRADRAPKGKLPYIRHGEQCISDSHFIIKYLQATYGSAPPNSALKPLDAKQQALCNACIHTTEARLSYAVGYYRFVAEAGWRRAKLLFRSLPLLPRWLVPRRLRARISRTFVTVGLGRHSLHDFNILLRDDLQTLSTLLDAKPYLLGPTPCEADASLFGIIDVILNDGVISCELRRIVEGFPNLCRQYAQNSFPIAFPRLTELTPGIPMRLLHKKPCEVADTQDRPEKREERKRDRGIERERER